MSSTKLKGHVPEKEVVQYAGLVCSDGGADFMSSHGASDFGEHDSMIPIIASGHEEMNFLKTLLKVAFHLGAGVMATFHTWATSKAQETLMSGCDTHKAIDFLLDVCKKSVETALVHEWLEHLRVTDSALDPKSVDSMWAWIDASTDANFRNHVHFWIKSLGALSLLRKAVRSHESSCHDNYRAAQKFLLPFFFACHATGWGPLLLRDIRVIDFQLTEELRVVYKEIFRLLIQGPDFYQEQTVKEIGRNQLHTATELSFKIGCLATANGSCISATLSSICGIPDRGKRDRTATAYVLEVDKCTEHLLLNRCFQQVDQRSQVLTIDAPGQLVPPKETPIGLWDFGLAAVPGYLQTGKYPANQLLRKNIHGLPPPQEDEDEDEGEGEEAV